MIAQTHDGISPRTRMGSLYPFCPRGGRDASRQELSFLQPQFKDVASWKTQGRAKVMELLRYDPPRCDPGPEVVERVDCGEYVREKLYFNTTLDIRVPAYLLLPKGEPQRRPAIIAPHDHGAFFVWGKEKVIACRKMYKAGVLPA